MEFFLDTASVDEIKSFLKYNIISGVTTNPSLFAQQKHDFRLSLKSICEMVQGPVSVEVISTSSSEMVREALDLCGIAKNIVIKLPLTWDGIETCSSLREIDPSIKTNLTLCFSVNQALIAAKAGATYISPFIGRLDDIGAPGIKLIEEIKKIYNNYNIETKIIAASIRNLTMISEIALLGADIATLPPKLLKQMLEHPLTDIGLDRFLEDWKKAGLNL